MIYFETAIVEALHDRKGEALERFCIRERSEEGNLLTYRPCERNRNEQFIWDACRFALHWLCE